MPLTRAAIGLLGIVLGTAPGYARAAEPDPVLKDAFDAKEVRERRLEVRCDKEPKFDGLVPILTGRPEMDDIVKVVSDTAEALDKSNRLVDVAVNVTAGWATNNPRADEITPLTRHSLLLAPGAAVRLNILSAFGVLPWARIRRLSPQTQQLGMLCRDVIPKLRAKYRGEIAAATAKEKEATEALANVEREAATLPPPITSSDNAAAAVPPDPDLDEQAIKEPVDEKVDVRLRRGYLKNLKNDLTTRTKEAAAELKAAKTSLVEAAVLDDQLARLQSRFHTASNFNLGIELGMAYAVEVSREGSDTSRSGVISTLGLVFGYARAQISVGGFLGDSTKGFYIGTGVPLFE